MVKCGSKVQEIAINLHNIQGHRIQRLQDVRTHTRFHIHRQ